MNTLFEKFNRGIEEIIPKSCSDTLKESKKPLKVKFGADPSAPDLHLGHMVVLNKLRLLQEMGHEIIFLIGDFTAMIGDPTGKSETRKPLTIDDVKANAETYQEQVFKILDKSKTRVVFNSEWLDKLTGSDMIKLSARYTVARMLERDDFNKRFKGERSISIHEFLYPLLQGYDSVALESDIEIGGTDQKFNLLMGRHLQREYGCKVEQSIITVPILEGLDGVQKMSKSLNNHVGIMETPQSIFGKLMSIPDELICRYFSLLTDKDEAEIKTIETNMKNGSLNPKLAKEDLAKTLVTFLHDATAAQAACDEFNRVFGQKKVPDDMPEIKLNLDEVRLDQLLTNEKIIASKKEIRRLVDQGAISINEEKISDHFYTFTPEDGQVLKIGKRRFYKLRTQ